MQVVQCSEAGSDGADLLPVRMLNEFVYCPRLFHFMHVEGRWAENVYTAEGKAVHRRVDAVDHVLPDPDRGGMPSSEQTSREKPDDEEIGDEPPKISRSVTLGSERLGITAKLDIVSTAGDEAVPVERKRGRVPANEERSWEPERVQLMAQGLLLRENGHRSDHGILYYAASRTRVDIPFTPELEARTLSYMAQAREAARRQDLPDPLEDSPKCNGCSLNGICLPDETLALRGVPADPTSPEVRRLYPARDEAAPFYIQEQGAVVGKKKGILVVKKAGKEIAEVRLKDTSQLVLCGSVSVTPQTVHLLCEAGVPIVHLSTGHWFYGITHGITLRNAFDRAAQFAAAADPSRRLQFAKALVFAKAINQRTLLRRNARPQPAAALEIMDKLAGRIKDAVEEGEVLGLEGSVAAQYFSTFAGMLSPRDFGAVWDYEGRNKRPPRDPVNALLSFTYALLAKECTVSLLAEGLDPWWGLFHRPRHGRPALALDLMEEFRPLVADSAVITAINTGMVTARTFTRSKAACMLNDGGRKGMIRAFEARLDQLVTHPIFNYRCSWRSVIRLQARLLSRWLRGDVPEYTGMVTR